MTLIPSPPNDDEDDIVVVQVSDIQSALCPCCGAAIIEFYGADGQIGAVVSLCGEALSHLAMEVDGLCEEILETDLPVLDTIGPTAGRA